MLLPMENLLLLLKTIFRCVYTIPFAFSSLHVSCCTIIAHGHWDPIWWFYVNSKRHPFPKTLCFDLQETQLNIQVCDVDDGDDDLEVVYTAPCLCPCLSSTLHIRSGAGTVSTLLLYPPGPSTMPNRRYACKIYLLNEQMFIVENSEKQKIKNRVPSYDRERENLCQCFVFTSSSLFFHSWVLCRPYLHLHLNMQLFLSFFWMRTASISWHCAKCLERSTVISSTSCH